MHRPYLSLTAAVALAATLAACGNSGGSAPPPVDVTATAGDGRIVLSWSSEPGVTYWTFGAADPGVTIDNWTDLPESFSVVKSRSPQPVCALVNGQTYWATINARTGTSGGGPGSAAVSATPRIAGETWTVTALDAPVRGTGYALVDYCRTSKADSNKTRPASGQFIAVGDHAGIYTSDDGVQWTRQAAPEGFVADLHAVDVRTLQPGSLDRLEQTWVAIGTDSATLVSENGIDWRVAIDPVPGSLALRSITHQYNMFVAVGDGGRIAITNNEKQWLERISPTTENLTSITYMNGTYAVTGENGTLMLSGDSVGWTMRDLGTRAHLRGIAYGNNNTNPGNDDEEEIDTWVVVGDQGTVARSLDNGRNWEPLVLPGAPNLVGVGYTTAFIAVDDAGGVWRSIDGANWEGPLASGPGPVKAISGLSEYGIVAILPDGRVAASF